MIFTVLYGSSFAVLKSFLDPIDAFIMASVLISLLGLSTYSIMEGLEYESKFNNLEVKGKMKFKKPETPSEPAEFEFNDDFKLTGEVVGKFT